MIPFKEKGEKVGHKYEREKKVGGRLYKNIILVRTKIKKRLQFRNEPSSEMEYCELILKSNNK